MIADMEKEIIFTEQEKKRLARLLAREDEILKRRRLKLAQQRAQAVARLLKEKWGAQAVYLFGSLAGGRLWEHSDLDFFVVGLPGSEHYYEILADAERIAAPFEVDLILEEAAPAYIKKAVAEKGVRLA
ncbi:MAG: nucleotidyltransferase domain-containing protein [Bacillota bacterium]|nr:nucleotidyltransferase domain-containing protein [Bacillota bacterium]